MVEILEFMNGFFGFVPIIRTVFILSVSFIIFSFVIRIINRAMLKKARTKKQRSNINIFTRMFTYFVLVILVFVGFFSYAGSWTGLGLFAGLLSAALGFALQKPISGIAAWIMVVIKRPFDIGDRIIIGEVKGDVTDISLTHISLDEVGGTVDSEDNSGRIIMIPNSVLFDMNVINYTRQDEYILDQVVTSLIYEGNLDKAMRVCLDAAVAHTKEFYEQANLKKPYVRVKFSSSSVDLTTRYFVSTTRRQEIATKITKEILENFRKEKDLEIAYPHTEVIYRKK